MNFLVSVIVPVYKVEKFLPECVESIRKQTHSNIEIILVDDGSPDNCPQICDTYAQQDCRIRVIHKENGGLSDARNAGKPFLLVYSYGLENEIVEKILMFAHSKNLRVLSACFPFSWCDGVFDCTALDFCAVMEKASFVFTSTYHGTIFSVLNHKQFVSLPQSRKTSDLLFMLGLSERLTDDTLNDAQFEAKFEKNIDYASVDKKIAQMREYSLGLLKAGVKRNG